MSGQTGPEEEFDWKLDRLAGKIGELSDNDVTFELAAIVAGLGDIISEFKIRK